MSEFLFLFFFVFVFSISFDYPKTALQSIDEKKTRNESGCLGWSGLRKRKIERRREKRTKRVKIARYIAQIVFPFVFLFTFFPSPLLSLSIPTMAAIAHSRAAARCSMASPAVACSSSARSVAASASSSRPASSSIAAALRAPRALPSLAAPRRAAAPARATRLACAAAKGYKVALLGAAGGIGQPLALLLKCSPTFAARALRHCQRQGGRRRPVALQHGRAGELLDDDGERGMLERVLMEERRREREGDERRKRATANCDGRGPRRSIDQSTEKERVSSLSRSLSPRAQF